MESFIKHQAVISVGVGVNEETGKRCRYTTKEFIEKAIKVHGNNYDYSKSKYNNNATKIDIICPIHGIFEQTPHIHLRGHGCSKCKPNGYSNMAIAWLTHEEQLRKIRIKHILNGGEQKIIKYLVDGFHEKSNTVFEFHGCFWHSHNNCDLYKLQPDKIHPIIKITHGKNYEKTKKRENEIKALGYNLIIMWECEWNKLCKEIDEILKCVA